MVNPTQSINIAHVVNSNQSIFRGKSQSVNILW